MFLKAQLNKHISKFQHRKDVQNTQRKLKWNTLLLLFEKNKYELNLSEDGEGSALSSGGVLLPWILAQ